MQICRDLRIRFRDISGCAGHLSGLGHPGAWVAGWRARGLGFRI